MRSQLVRSLAALLVLALIGGNVHSRLQLTMPKLLASQAHQHQQAAGMASHDNPIQQENGSRCCCDSLSCITGYTLTPAPDLGNIVTAVFGAAPQNGAETTHLRGRVLPPEPKPPKPDKLT